MQKSLLPIFLFAGLSLANEMCLELCEPCKNSGSNDATCAKVFEACKCAELFQKVEAEAAAKTQRTNARRAALGNSLYEECAQGKCRARIWFEGAELTKLEAKKNHFMPAKEPEVAPLQNECPELRKIVANDPENKMAAQIENSCGCAAHVKDSLALVEFKVARIKGANSAADDVAKFCEAEEVCKVELELDDETFRLTSLGTFEPKPEFEPEPEPAKFTRLDYISEAISEACSFNNSVVTCDIRFTFQGALPSHRSTVNSSTTSAASPLRYAEEARKAAAVQAANEINDYCASEAYCDVDVSLDGGSLELLALAPHRGSFPYKEAEPVKNDPSKPAQEPEKKQYSYGGFMLYGGFGSWSYSKDYFDWVSSGGVDAGLGYLHRWYFYKWGSFQLGFNVNYNYIDLGSDSYYVNLLLGSIEYDLLYHKISAEIPLQLRLGAPYIYGTFLLAVRKQIWSVLVIDDGDETEYSYSALTGDDWNFQGYLGFGLELSRHFLIDFMWNLFDLGTAGDYVEQDDLFRLQLNFAW